MRNTRLRALKVRAISARSVSRCRPLFEHWFFAVFEVDA